MAAGWQIAQNIGDRIRDLRRILSSRPGSALPQEELGKRAGVRPSQVSQWERGSQQPSKSRLERWAEREGWPVSIFAEGEAGPADVLPVGGATAAASADEGSAGADALLAEFYRLMAQAAEAGQPFPPDLARIVGRLHEMARRQSAAEEPEVPGW